MEHFRKTYRMRQTLWALSMMKPTKKEEEIPRFVRFRFAVCTMQCSVFRATECNMSYQLPIHNSTKYIYFFELLCSSDYKNIFIFRLLLIISTEMYFKQSLKGKLNTLIVKLSECECRILQTKWNQWKNCIPAIIH